MSWIQNSINSQVPASVGGTLPPSGYAGAIFTLKVASASAIPVTSGTIFNLLSIPLPIGNFKLVGANIWYSCSVGSTGANSWTSITSVTVPDFDEVGGITLASGTFNTLCAIAPGKIYSLTAATTIYLSGVAAFTSGTCTACGMMTLEQF